MFNYYSNIIKLVTDAGDLILKKTSEEETTYIEKEKFNYVTEKDIQVQNYIIENLMKINNEWKVLSEESVTQILDLKNGWILDPIDGTTNYIHSYPHYALSLAHIINGQTQFGVIYNPISKELYTAYAGGGAYLNGEKIKVSNSRRLKDSIIGVGFPYDRNKAEYIFDTMKNLYLECQDIKRKGSAALDLAYVASGRLDGYFELDLKIWDVSAGKLLIEEAGGEFITIKVMNDSKLVIVSNGNLTNELKAICKLVDK